MLYMVCSALFLASVYVASTPNLARTKGLTVANASFRVNLKLPIVPIDASKTEFVSADGRLFKANTEMRYFAGLNNP